MVVAGAHSTWFHLYRLVLEQPPDIPATAEKGQQQEQVQRVALAVEQFLQTSTVGEYEQRLSMVWSFRFALCPCHNQGGGGLHDCQGQLYHCRPWPLPRVPPTPASIHV